MQCAACVGSPFRMTPCFVLNAVPAKAVAQRAFPQAPSPPSQHGRLCNGCQPVGGFPQQSPPQGYIRLKACKQAMQARQCKQAMQARQCKQGMVQPGYARPDAATRFAASRHASTRPAAPRHATARIPTPTSRAQRPGSPPSRSDMPQAQVGPFLGQRHRQFGDSS